MRYILFMLPVYILTLVIQLWLNGTVKKYSKVRTSRGINGAAAANQVVQRGGAYGVKIARIRGSLTDNFNPASNTVFLSEPVCDVSSVTAVGIACHEAGHALQYAEGYGPMKLRAALIPVCNFGSRLSFPLMIIGMILQFDLLIFIGVLCFSLIALVQLVTLPVEFNASRRAMEAIRESGLLTQEEQKGARRVLTAAAMTYVGALATSLLQLLYYVRRFKR